MPPLTMNEAAQELGVSRRWLQDFLPTIPPCWLQAGRKKLFDEKAMDAIREAMRVKPVAPLRRAAWPARRLGSSAAPSAESQLIEALRLATAGRRPKTAK